MNSANYFLLFTYILNHLSLVCVLSILQTASAWMSSSEDVYSLLNPTHVWHNVMFKSSNQHWLNMTHELLLIRTSLHALIQHPDIPNPAIWNTYKEHYLMWCENIHHIKFCNKGSKVVRFRTNKECWIWMIWKN